MVEEDSQWILESPTTISRIESQSALTATSMTTWSKNVGIRRKRKKPGSVSSVTKKGTS